MTITTTLTEAWPGLFDLAPAATVTARIARRLFLHAIKRADVTVHLDGQQYGRGGPAMTIVRPDEFFHRLGRDKNIGLGEAYMTGAWESDELGDFFTVLCGDIANLIPKSLQTLRGVVIQRPPRNEQGDIADTRRNIARHYDLSNDLFALFLDPTMTYSCAWFETDALGNPIAGDDLERAQHRKIDALLDAAGVTSGTSLLEIGTGWGELAMRAAARGAMVRTITLSEEQQALARERIAAAGLSERVSVDLCDYRAVEGSYDAVVSVEMIEAVGWRYWATYLETLDRVLAPGGRAAIQAITMPHDRMKATRNTYSWITKYIFPGGFLPSVRVLEELARQRTTLRLCATTAIGPHYAETLRQWDQKFLKAAQERAALGFDETFGRMWHYYLEYSRAGFASGYINDHQLVFARSLPPHPARRRDR